MASIPPSATLTPIIARPFMMSIRLLKHLTPSVHTHHSILASELLTLRRFIRPRVNPHIGSPARQGQSLEPTDLSVGSLGDTTDPKSDLIQDPASPFSPRFHRGLRTYGPAARLTPGPLPSKLFPIFHLPTPGFLALQGPSLEPIDLSMGLLMGPSLASSDAGHTSFNFLPRIFPRFHRGLRTYGPAALNTATGIRTIRFLARQGLSLEPIDLSMGLLMGPSLASSDAGHTSFNILPCIFPRFHRGLRTYGPSARLTP